LTRIKKKYLRQILMLSFKELDVTAQLSNENKPTPPSFSHFEKEDW